MSVTPFWAITCLGQAARCGGCGVSLSLGLLPAPRGAPSCRRHLLSGRPAPSCQQQDGVLLRPLRPSVPQGVGCRSAGAHD